MSIKVSKLIWPLKISATEKIILLFYADLASHDGTQIWPAIKSVAINTSLSERTVQAVTKKLVQERILVRRGWSRFHTKLLSIDLVRIYELFDESERKEFFPEGAPNRDSGVNLTVKMGESTSPNPLSTINKPLSSFDSRKRSRNDMRYAPQKNQEIQKILHSK